MNTNISKVSQPQRPQGDNDNDDDHHMKMTTTTTNVANVDTDLAHRPQS